MSMEIEVQKSLYETDYQLWLAQTLNKLQFGDFENIDIENLIDEVES